MIEVVEALDQQLGDQIRRRAEVADVTVNIDDTVSVTYRWQGEEVVTRAHAVVLTTPAPVTTNPALEMKPSLSVATPAAPCTNQT